jgi:ribosomal protein S18 acetylase RimI-like enzyme
MKQLWSAQRTLRAELLLRLCAESDLDGLEWFGLFAHDRAAIREAWARHLAGANDMVVVDLAGFPVAQIWIDLERRGPDTAFLWAVRVFPLFRGHGIGGWMLTEVEAWMARRGFAALELSVEPWNQRAFSLYERLGYRECGVLEDVGFGGPLAEARQRLMRKPLRTGAHSLEAFPPGRAHLPLSTSPD